MFGRNECLYELVRWGLQIVRCTILKRVGLVGQIGVHLGKGRGNDQYVKIWRWSRETGAEHLRGIRITVVLRLGNVGWSIDGREAIEGVQEECGVCFSIGEASTYTEFTP